MVSTELKTIVGAAPAHRRVVFVVVKIVNKKLRYYLDYLSYTLTDIIILCTSIYPVVNLTVLE